jgi:hypothetical protein
MCGLPIAFRWLGRRYRTLLAVSILGFIPALASAQVGVINGPANSLLSCLATVTGTPLLRPEGYTELLGDILIECTGGPTFQLGANIPTTNLVVYVVPGVPITSRILSSTDKSSEAMLIIDEAGSTIPTGATGGYGPQAPQSLCSTAQQTGPTFLCPAVVGLDNSGGYQVAVIPGTSTPAQNVYQGRVGDYGSNSVVFYNVPVLPPAYQGVIRTFRITNIRIPVPGGSVTGAVQALLSSNPNQTLPVASTLLNVGIVGPSMSASVNASPAGGGSPFDNCAPVTTPALSARLTYTEGFATGFRTRVVPGGPTGANTTWAGEAQNLASPSNQNIPGGFYGGFASNSESGFIVPTANYTDPISNVTYTAGLADYGTRLKAVFYNIPAGLTVYVSTTNTGSPPAIPGGTSVSSYAVLVSGESVNDGSSFTPLTSTMVGSDGYHIYPLPLDNSGVDAEAVWEVVNSNPGGIDNLTFSVYIAYGSQFPTLNPMTVALSYAPEPGGGTFTTVNATAGLTNPSPRYAVVIAHGGPYANINVCPLFVTGTTPVQLGYAFGGAAPSGVGLYVHTTPSNLAVTVTSTVTTPTGGAWLSAAINSGILSIAANPANLAVSNTPYTGTVQLSATGVKTVTIPVTLTVFTTSPFLISASHVGNFGDGQTVTSSIVVSNASATTAATGSVTVTEGGSSGLALVSMMGTGWNCGAPTCTRSDSLAAGTSYQPITATFNVSTQATSPQVAAAYLSVPGTLTLQSNDVAIVTGASCAVTNDATVSVADAQAMVDQLLGESTPGADLNFDGVVNIADVQIVINAILNSICIV